VLPNELGRTVHFPGNGKGKGSCCGVVFMTFLKFFLKCREGNPCREVASNALSVLGGIKSHAIPRYKYRAIDFLVHMKLEIFIQSYFINTNQDIGHNILTQLNKL